MENHSSFAHGKYWRLTYILCCHTLNENYSHSLKLCCFNQCDCNGDYWHPIICERN